MAFTAGETGLIFYCVNHLTQPVKSYILLCWPEKVNILLTVWKMLGTVDWSVTAPAGVCGAPVQVVPVGPVWNSLIYVCSMYLFVLFTQCLSFFKFVGVQVKKPNNQI